MYNLCAKSVWVSLLLVSLTGCQMLISGDSHVDYGAKEQRIPTLEIPPDLTVPAADGRYRIAPVGEATYSDYSHTVTAPGAATSMVLPELQSVRLEHDASGRWLVVSDKPDNVWTNVKIFWQELGLAIDSEDQAAGVMQTAWAANRATTVPHTGLRKLLGKIFSNVYSSGQVDQYLTRLERSKDGLSTEVHITMRSKEEMLTKDRTQSVWEERPGNPEVEAAVLQRLMVRLGASESQAKNATQETRPAEHVEVATTTGAASLREDENGKNLIVISDTFDKAWRSVGLAIEHASLTVEDKNRDQGVYFLAPIAVKQGVLDKLRFWKGKQDNHYRVHVENKGAVCVVSVSDQSGVSNKTTKQILELLYKNLDHP
jgi:outer membrane protein assembly factor BamC